MITSSLLGWPPLKLGSVQQAPGTTSAFHADSPVGAIAAMAGHFLRGPAGAASTVGAAGAALGEADAASGAAVGAAGGVAGGGGGVGLGGGGGEHAENTSIAAAGGKAPQGR